MKNLILTAIASTVIISAHAAGHLRVNQVGYLTDDIKAAVYMGDRPITDYKITLKTPAGKTVDVDSITIKDAWDPFDHTARIYFTSVTTPGEYTLTLTHGKEKTQAQLYIGDDAYSRLSLQSLPLNYLRQQRCGFNPVHADSCHTHDGRLVLSGDNDDTIVDVTGGWHDASDYLQYLTTSANTVYQMLFAYRMNPDPAIWGDNFDSAGLPGSNGIPDILDEARWGLEWMCRMNPREGVYYNQIADDRDHRFAGLPADDNVDYGWGEGNARPVYPCAGYPYGLKGNLNRSTGEASSVAKYASSFALGSEIFADIDPEFAHNLAQRAGTAYKHAANHPGACQTAPCVSPYFYEEDNWADDLELAAMAQWRATGDRRYITEAVNYGRLEPVTPWMGADSARHYQWYPFINLGHFELSTAPDRRVAEEFTRNMKSGLDRVSERGADNVFLNGIPFIWCSNNLATAFVTQAMLYRLKTGDNQYRDAETAVRDWLFGVNPWGQVMLVMPQSSVASSPLDCHSAMTDRTVNGRPGRDFLIGGLVDGPVYNSIFSSLRGVHLRNADRFAPFQGSTVVYHDDYSDYSTNEPTMDGTASTLYMLGQLASKGVNQ